MMNSNLREEKFITMKMGILCYTKYHLKKDIAVAMVANVSPIITSCAGT